MSSCLCECCEGSREHEREYNHYGNRVRTRCDGAFNGKFVEKVNRHHKERQDHGSDDHGNTSGYAIAVVVVDTIIIGLLPSLLTIDHCQAMIDEGGGLVLTFEQKRNYDGISVSCLVDAKRRNPTFMTLHLRTFNVRSRIPSSQACSLPGLKDTRSSFSYMNRMSFL